MTPPSSHDPLRPEQAVSLGSSGRAPSGAGYSGVRVSPADKTGPDDVTRVAPSRGGGPPPGNDIEAPLIDGYAIHEEIYRGGQGIVYRATQLGTKREVALKVILEGPYAGDDARRRFEREVELAASLKHPNIVTILDSGVSHERYYFAMDFIRGQRLDRHFQSAHPSLVETLKLCEKIAHGVNFAHQRGVIHRDLKPSNIMIDADGEPQILDFGLAKHARQGAAHQTTVQLLSVTGQILGTVAYMSPEQAASPQDIDVRSDVYSLGVIFYEILLGQPPYPISGPLGEVLTNIARVEPSSPRSIRMQSRFGREIDDELSTILLKALEKEPDRRYQTAGDLASDIGRYLRGEPIEAKRASGLYMLRKTLRRYRVQTAAAGLMLAMVLGFLIVFAVLYQRERASRALAADKAQKAETARLAAEEAEQRERTARRDAEQLAGSLHKSVLRQKIQRGDVARAQGDLAGARDSYWEAFADTDDALTHWNLRQYYMETGEVSSHQLAMVETELAAVSPDGRLAAVCDTRTSLCVRDVLTDEILLWAPLPGAATCLGVDALGRTTVAGRGWLRVFERGVLKPRHVVELPDGFVAEGITTAAGGRLVYLADAERLMCIDLKRGEAAAEQRFNGRRTGPLAGSTTSNRCAVPTDAGVELFGLRGDGVLSAELIAATQGLYPRGVRFLDDDRLVVLTNVVTLVHLGGVGRGRSELLMAPAGTWDLLDVAPGASVVALAAEDGRVAVFRLDETGRDASFAGPPNRRVPRLPGEALAATQEWRVTHLGLRQVLLSPDGEALLTVDSRGTLTRWDVESPQRRRVLPRAVFDIGAARDGSTAALLDTDGRVTIIDRERVDQPRAIPGSRLIMRIAGLKPSDVSMSFDATGKRLLLRFGGMVQLVDVANERSIFGVSWAHADVPTLRQSALSDDGAVIAFCAESLAGDQQQIFLCRTDAARPAVGRRRLTAPELLAPAAEPVSLIGSAVRSIQFFPDSRELLLVRSNGVLATFRAEAGVQTWATLESPAAAVAFDARGRRVAAACDDGAIRVLSRTDGATIGRINVGQRVASLCYDPRGEVLLVRLASGDMRLYDALSFEAIAQSRLSDSGAHPVAQWFAGGASILASMNTGVWELRFERTDAVIEENKRYARQRDIVRHMNDGELAAAWAAATGFETREVKAAEAAQQEVLCAILRRRGAAIPSDASRRVSETDNPVVLARLGNAAYEGGRFAMARGWLRAAVENSSELPDALSLRRLAECDYLIADDAAAAFELVLSQPDLDLAAIPTVQLEWTAALYRQQQMARVRSAADQIGRHPRIRDRSDLVATTAARSIGAYIAGGGVQSLLSAAVTQVVANFAEGSADYQDDPYFFSGEMALARGDRDEALAQYRRCLDAARDDWPSNWARYRIERLLAPDAPP
ncbi:MAG: Serine/threonine-protein kinase PknD [Phycisphaerae bacterium]|nr:Serine/threonine-protein kinase PknD [Phycisphaerae bacterium]